MWTKTRIWWLRLCSDNDESIPVWNSIDLYFVSLSICYFLSINLHMSEFHNNTRSRLLLFCHPIIQNQWNWYSSTDTYFFVKEVYSFSVEYVKGLPWMIQLWLLIVNDYCSVKICLSPKLSSFWWLDSIIFTKYFNILSAVALFFSPLE